MIITGYFHSKSVGKKGCNSQQTSATLPSHYLSDFVGGIVIGGDLEILSGLIAEFDKAIIVHKDVKYFGPIRDEVCDLTITHRQLNHIEILIGGYDGDERSLYEVPEVRRWVKLLHTRWPDLMFWLTPGSLWLCVLCLNPKMHERLPDGRLQIIFDTDWILREVAMSHVAATEILMKAGMTEDVCNTVIEQAQQNILQLFEQKKLGDYAVVHPNTGKIITYRRETE